MAGIVLTIEVDDKGSVKVKQFSDKTKEVFDEMKKGPEQAKGSLNSLSEGWVALTAKITAAAAVVYGITKTLSSFIDEAAQAEEIENRLRFALETTGYTWQYAKTAVDQFANSIQKSTRFSDEQARQALTDMMMYTNDFAKAQVGSKLAMDMSIRTGMDLVTSARYIGMAMSGNVEMLGRYIPQLRNLDGVLGSNATMAEKAAYAMKILQEKFGGTAQADVKTYAGTVAQFKNQWSDLKEEIGYGLLPILKETFGWLTKIFKEMRDQRELMKEGGETGFWSQFRKPIPGMPYSFEPGKEGGPTGGIYKGIGEATRLGLLAAETKKDILPESLKSKSEIEKTILEYHKFFAEVNKLSEAGKMPSWEDSLWSFPGRTLPDINALNLEFNMLLANAEQLGAAGTMPDWRESLEDIPKGFVEIEDHLYTLRDIIDSYDTEAAQWTKDWVANWKKSALVGDTFAQNMASSWDFNLKRIVSESKNMGDAVKNVFYGMADAFASSVSKMISNWVLFGSVTGGYEAGKGVVGWLGTALNAIIPMQHGGWINEPIYGIGKSGQRYTFGESESEMVIPKSQAGQASGNTYTYYIDARGAQRGVSAEIRRAIRESENRAVVRSVSQVVDNKMRGGRFAKIFES